MSATIPGTAAAVPGAKRMTRESCADGVTVDQFLAELVIEVGAVQVCVLLLQKFAATRCSMKTELQVESSLPIA
jgi:hypothetical protein